MRDGSAGEVFRPTFDVGSSGMRTEILEGGYEREEESKEFFTGDQEVYRDFRKGLVKISGMSANGRGSERSFEQFDRLMSHGIADQIKSNPNKDIVDMFRPYNDVYVENEDGSTRRPSVGYNASLRHETGFIRDDDRIVSNFLHGIRTYRFQYAKSRRENNPGSTQELAPIRLNRGKMNELFGQLIEKVQQRYEKHVHDKADEDIQKEDIEMMQRLIVNMAYMGDRDTIDSVLELVAKYHDIDTRGVEYALSAVDAAYAAQQTIKKIREPRKDDESLDSYNSRVEKFSLIAYKIELGKVGVTDGVVKYLEQKFVLQGKEVDDITSARRVTGDGKMGLFDMDGGILGYFEIGDLSKSGVERHVHILEVTRDLLFSDPNTPDAVRQEFLENYTLFYENIFGEEMGVRMSDLTLREQVWLYNYWAIDCNKETDGEKWQAAIQLKKEYGVDGVRIFMVLENTDRGSEELDSVLEMVEKHPEDGLVLVHAFSEFLHQTDAVLDEMELLYKDIFFSKKIDSGKLRNIFLARAVSILGEYVHVFKTCSPEERQPLVDDLVKDIQYSLSVQRDHIHKLHSIGQELNQAYADVLDSHFGNLVDDWGDAWSDTEVVDEQLAKRLQEEKILHDKYDSDRVTGLIAHFESEYILSPEIIEEMRAHHSGDGFDEMIDEIQKSAKEEYEPFVAKLKRLLHFQRSFEQKLDTVVYGTESVELPSGMFDSLDEVSRELTPEVETVAGEWPMYFPVGISKDFFEWEKVFSGEKIAAKPIDMYAYLFWLENQNKPVELVIADTVQVNNFLHTGDMMEEDAFHLANKIGIAEAKKYQHIIDQFGLKHISIVRYDAVKQKNDFSKEDIHVPSKRAYNEQGKTPHAYYVDFCTRLSTTPMWKNLFDSLAGAVGQGGDAGIAYGIDEVAFILAARGEKVSHVNEARYDVVAGLLTNIEKRAIEEGIDIFELLQNVPDDVRTIGEDMSSDPAVKLAKIVHATQQEMFDMVNTKKIYLKSLLHRINTMMRWEVV